MPLDGALGYFQLLGDFAVGETLPDEIGNFALAAGEDVR